MLSGVVSIVCSGAGGFIIFRPLELLSAFKQSVCETHERVSLQTFQAPKSYLSASSYTASGLNTLCTVNSIFDVKTVIVNK